MQNIFSSIQLLIIQHDNRLGIALSVLILSIFNGNVSRKTTNKKQTKNTTSEVTRLISVQYTEVRSLA